MMKKTDAWAALSDDEKAAVRDSLQTHLEGEHKGYDPVHGILLNIEASRIARHLGVRGPTISWMRPVLLPSRPWKPV